MKKINVCLVFILTLSGCASLHQNTKRFEKDADLVAISDLVRLSVLSDKSNPNISFEKEYKKLNLLEQYLFCRTLSLLYWDLLDRTDELSTRKRWRIAAVLSSPIGYCGKQESKRIALYTTYENERELSLRFYSFSPSILDYPFLNEYIKIHGLQSAPFPVFPDRFLEYNIRKYNAYLKDQQSGGDIVRHLNAAKLLKKDIYNQLDEEIWNEGFKELAINELLKAGYSQKELIPQNNYMDADIDIEINQILMLSGERKKGQP